MRTVVLVVLWLGLAAKADDEKALLASIQQNPEEDTPRLVYADWLDENAKGDSDRARAEFIRLEVGLARRNDVDATDYKSARTRADALLNQYHKEWTPTPLKGLTWEPLRSNHSARLSKSELIWRRGFIEGARMDLNRRKPGVLSALEELPALQDFECIGTLSRDDFDVLQALSFLPRLRGFKLLTPITDQWWSEVSKRLPNLERLLMNGYSQTHAAFITMEESPFAANLRALTLSGYPATALARLWDSEKFPVLATLGFHRGITPPPLPRSPTGLPALRNLELIGIASHEVFELQGIPRINQIRQIRFTNSDHPDFATLRSVSQLASGLVHIEVDTAHAVHFPPDVMERLRENRVRLGCAEVVSAFAN